ncbi:tetratricopeptide repeat protein [uncultured Hyphomicrobium sp.]|uniref:CHAT domain-containing tetratricopeptide repeat protein n=1 Tax=uncultured Hyphomicrobium sp. TaxID=194373 RepID=UPI0025D2A0D1|nr:tetratricopeptide repeat protein [uncultured Hyphomicrobium sp.]
MRLAWGGRLAGLIVAGSVFFGAPAAAQDTNSIDALNAEAARLSGQGKYAEAAPISERLLALREAKLGPSHPEVATSLNDLATIYRALARYADAEAMYKRSLAMRETALGREHLHVAISLNNLGSLYRLQGRYADAEPLYKRSLAIREAALGPNHADVATVLNNLALLYFVQGRYPDAEPLWKRSLAIWEANLGPEHPNIAQNLTNLGEMYRSQGRYNEAEPLSRRSLAMREKLLGGEHPDVAQSLNNLAAIYRLQGRLAEAEPLYKRSLAIFEKLLGQDHPNVAMTLTNLAELYRAEARYDEAESMYKRALTKRMAVLGRDHPDVNHSLDNLAGLALLQEKWAVAADYWRQSTAVIRRRTERGLTDGSHEQAHSEATRHSWQFHGLIKVDARIGADQGAEREKLAEEMFETAQWVQTSDAADTLSQMAARSAKGDAALAALVRERQDLVAEWQAKDKSLIAARSQLPDRRSAQAEGAIAARIAAIDARLAEIDARFATEFPDYAALASPKPMSLADVQGQLRDDEALVLFMDTDEALSPLPEETFIWVVTRTDHRRGRTDMGTEALRTTIAALRCGLDHDAWRGGRRASCNTSLGLASEAPRPATLPFDLERSHALYTALFGGMHDLIAEKHLLIVPSGPLTQLPFQVLVTDKPASPDDYANVPWLAKRHAMTVLPSVTSLAALRRNARPAAALRSYAAFANPLLEGQGSDEDKKRAALAAAKRDCEAVTQINDIAAMSEAFAATSEPAVLGGEADVSYLRKLTPVPQTADLACNVAKAVGASEDDIRLGARATEASVKDLSASGVLASYAVINFATHGAVAGELTGGAEPGLILTPPKSGTEIDDGYLSASEVAALKLDADWVVLSACNTAASDANSAEALSGLARAFFYAGARALLVSHWPVREDAAAAIATQTFAEMRNDPSIGRSEAFRHAMLALMSDPKRPWAAHPSVWAPFVVVGEGGVRATP